MTLTHITSILQSGFLLKKAFQLFTSIANWMMSRIEQVAPEWYRTCFSRPGEGNENNASHPAQPEKGY
jgi:hypothetical protein